MKPPKKKKKIKNLNSKIKVDKEEFGKKKIVVIQVRGSFIFKMLLNAQTMTSMKILKLIFLVISLRISIEQP